MLAGDEDERLTLYAFRKHLGYDADEVIAMPWWKRRMYVEGMNFEVDGRGDGDVG